jgi:hypothetical protein
VIFSYAQAEPELVDLEHAIVPPALLVLDASRGTEYKKSNRRGTTYKKSRGKLDLDFPSRESDLRRVLGMESGEYGPCPIPGHHGVARLGEDDRGYGWGLICNCLGTDLKYEAWRTDFWRPLSDVYRAVWTGQTIQRADKLPRGVRLVWMLLLAHEVGLLDPAPVPLPPLRPDAGDLEHKVAAFYRLLAGLRVAIGGELKTPLSVTLVMEYFRIRSRAEANAPLQALRRSGVLIGTRARQSGYYEYVPGMLDSQPERSSSNEREMRPDGIQPSSQHAIR